jgi:hypothetical protein
MMISSSDIRRYLLTMALLAVVTLGAMAQADAAFSHAWVGKNY